MSFVAEFKGVCSACDERFPKGIEVEYDLEGDLIHVGCPSLRTATPRPICPRCFMEIPVNGVCGTCEPE